MWRYGLKLLLFALVFIAIVPRSTVLINDKWQAIGFTVSEHQFDYIGWEINAIAAKLRQVVSGQRVASDAAARTQHVREYMADLARAQTLEAQIAAIYSNPAISNPDLESAALQEQRDALRADLQRRQSKVEAILEQQVTTILLDEGFGIMGQLLPPVSMRFTQVPTLLVASPRDSIRMETSINLYALPIDEQAALEAAIDTRYDVSAIIVPLGGIALYPAMITETTSIPFAVETFAHEWLHHYLFFFPLGVSYFTGDSFAGEARIINETTADLFGKEIGRLVLERYYPDLVPPPATNDAAVTPPAETDPDVFDFAAEMNETRVTVDQLLAIGAVDEAEMYMQERERFFFDNGVPIRKINQAFFAFYGGYQAGGGFAGAGGEDPIGPAVRAVREQSASLHDFVLQMRSITTGEQLLERAASE